MLVVRAMAVAGCLAAANCAEVQSGAYSAVPLAPPGGATQAVLLNGQIVAVQALGNTVAVYVRDGQVAPGLAASLFLSVTNRTDHAIELDEDNVVVEALGHGAPQRLAFESGDEMLASAKRTYDDRKAVATLLGALRERAAYSRAANHQASGTTVVNGHLLDYTVDVFNPVAGEAAASIERQQTEKILQGIETKRREAIAEARSLSLTHLTVEPSQTAVVMVQTRPAPDAEPATDLVARVRMDGEDYVFNYKLMRN